MLPERNSSYDEIIALLQAELECAKSLQASSAEIQSLVETGKFEQARERLVCRGDVVDLMVSLDHQVENILAHRTPVPETDAWRGMVRLAEELRGVVTSIMGHDRVSRENLERKREEISRNLKKLIDGKKLVKGYRQNAEKVHFSTYGV